MSEIISTRLRLPASLYRRLKAMADRERRSLHSQIIYLLEQAAKDEEEPQ